MKRKLIGLATCILAPLIFTACDTVADKQRAEARAERVRAHNAERLEQGNAALEACIEARCEELDLDGMRLTDFSVLNELSHVTSLMVSRSNFDDISDIGGMTQLKELHISRTNVRSLDGIEAFTNLHLLHAQSLGAGADIDSTPVAALDGLTELVLWHLNSVEDAVFVEDLPVLENLIVGWKGDADNLDFLSNHKSLRRIEISASMPLDQSALLSIENLQSVMFEGSPGAAINSEVWDTLNARGVVLEQLIYVC